MMKVKVLKVNAPINLTSKKTGKALNIFNADCIDVATGKPVRLKSFSSDMAGIANKTFTIEGYKLGDFNGNPELEITKNSTLTEVSENTTASSPAPVASPSDIKADTKLIAEIYHELIKLNVPEAAAVNMAQTVYISAKRK